jgi:peptidoglycan/xylan/chitin deacetylase (PgdA/CDA1 family)
MRLPGYKALRQTARWLRGRFVPGALILGYHRVASSEHDPFGLCVASERFSDHLKILKKLTSMLRLSELAASLKDRKLLSRSVVVTLDDGYADALHQALPLLEKFEVPATIFVTTGNPGKAFWWDRLEHMLFSLAELPDEFTLSSFGINYTWRVAADNSGAALNKSRLLQGVYRSLLPLPSQKREECLHYISEWSGNSPDPDTSVRSLSESELTALANSGLIEIGAHSVTHPVLAKENVTNLQTEIVGSKKYLESLLGQSIFSFSYPNGSYSNSAAEMVRNTGYHCACGSNPDIVHPRSDLFNLPRFWVSHLNRDQFIRWIKYWLK